MSDRDKLYVALDNLIDAIENESPYEHEKAVYKAFGEKN